MLYSIHNEIQKLNRLDLQWMTYKILTSIAGSMNYRDKGNGLHKLLTESTSQETRGFIFAHHLLGGENITKLPATSVIDGEGCTVDFQRVA